MLAVVSTFVVVCDGVAFRHVESDAERCVQTAWLSVSRGDCQCESDCCDRSCKLANKWRQLRIYVSMFTSSSLARDENTRQENSFEDVIDL